MPSNNGTLSQRGVSFIGCCAALTIAGVVVSGAATAIRQAHDRAVVEGAALELAASLQFARSEAVARNEAVRFSFYDSPGGQCYLVHTGQRDDCVCESGGKASCVNGALVLRSEFEATGPALHLAASVGSIEFNARSGGALPAGTFCVVPVEGQPIHHSVNETGRVRVCSPAAAGSACAPC